MHKLLSTADSNEVTIAIQCAGDACTETHRMMLAWFLCFKKIRVTLFRVEVRFFKNSGFPEASGK